MKKFYKRIREPQCDNTNKPHALHDIVEITEMSSDRACYRCVWCGRLFKQYVNTLDGSVDLYYIDEE
jgi:hypothetical protein